MEGSQLDRTPYHSDYRSCYMICLIRLNQKIPNFVYFLQWIFLFLPPPGIIFAMCILFKLDITLEAVALLGLRSARVVILIWEHIAPSEGVVHIPYSTYLRGTYLTHTEHISSQREGTQLHTHTFRGVYLPYSYTQHIAPREREGTYSYLERCVPTILIHMDAAHLPSQIWPRHLLSPHSRPNQVPTNATGARVFWKPHSARIPSRLLGSFFWSRKLYMA